MGNVFAARARAMGDGLVGFVAFVGRFALFIGRIIEWIFRQRQEYALLRDQCYRIGIESLPVIGIVCVFVGTNTALVGYQIFKQFGGQDMLGIYVGASCIREMAPMLAGAMMAAKPGTDMCATIATMRVKEQIDALEVMAVNPFWFLIVPRFLAFMLVTPFLVIYADFLSVASGYMVSVYQLGLNGGKFIADVAGFVTIQDFINGMAKGFFFAMLTCAISCFYGYYSAPGPRGVSQAINRSVVTVATLIVIANFFITASLYP